MTLKKDTICKYCGKPISLLRTTLGKTIACEANAEQFDPGDDGDTFVLMDGRVFKGYAIEEGTMIGYKKHLTDCKGKR